MYWIQPPIVMSWLWWLSFQIIYIAAKCKWLQQKQAIKRHIKLPCPLRWHSGQFGEKWHCIKDESWYAGDALELDGCMAVTTSERKPFWMCLCVFISLIKMSKVIFVGILSACAESFEQLYTLVAAASRSDLTHLAMLDKHKLLKGL